MKAEERHELKQNDLASFLQYGLPMWLKQNGSYVVLALALVFLAYQLYGMWQRKQYETRQAGWAELQTVQNPSIAGPVENPPAKLQSIIDTYDIKELKSQAYHTLGTFYSRVILFPEQLASLNLTKSEALTKAFDAFKKAGELQPDDPLILAKATLGMAAVKEDQGQWEEAAKMYVEMCSRFANSPFADLARHRLNTMPDRRNAPALASEIRITPTSQPGISLPGSFGTLPDLTIPAPGGGGGMGATGGGGGTVTGFGAPGSLLPEIPTAPASRGPTPGTQPQ
jgi:tetratricopeptide (TPR) repeat protein